MKARNKAQPLSVLINILKVYLRKARKEKNLDKRNDILMSASILLKMLTRFPLSEAADYPIDIFLEKIRREFLKLDANQILPKGLLLEKNEPADPLNFALYSLDLFLNAARTREMEFENIFSMAEPIILWLAKVNWPEGFKNFVAFHVVVAIFTLAHYDPLPDHRRKIFYERREEFRKQIIGH